MSTVFNGRFVFVSCFMMLASFVTCAQAAEIGDRIWQDFNANGVMDSGEPGFANVEVSLLLCDGTFVQSTRSAADGAYRFRNLAANSYRVRLNVPVGYRVSPLSVGHWSTDSDFFASGVSGCRTVSGNERRLAVDGGLVTVAGGTGAIGNFVWHDLNRNGLQDGGEPGLAGAVVELQTCDGTAVSRATTTAGGGYLFNGLAAGQYRLRIAAPAGFSITQQGNGPQHSIDSDFDPSTGLTNCRLLGDGQARLGIDGGLTGDAAGSGEVTCPGGGTALLGDWVWEDRNGDGIQQRGTEPGLAGIEVRLYECAGRPDSGCRCNATPLCTTTTDTTGLFGFSGLAAGSYQLRITVAGTRWRDGPTHVVSWDRDNDFGNHFNDGDVVGYCKPMVNGQRRRGADAGLVPR